MALVLPLFLLLIFGIMEFSYALAQRNEIRHATGEGARAAAVGDEPNSLICGSLTLIDRNNVDYDFSPVLGAVPNPDQGVGSLTVRAGYHSLTGMFDGMIALEFESTEAFFVEGPYTIPADGRCD